MSTNADIWICPSCGKQHDIATLAFYSWVECAECHFAEHVHTLIGNYRLEGELGIGGMSIVLRGRDLVLDRPLAIKLLNDTYKGEATRRASFERECALMAKVRHENVVSVYTAGHARGQFYIAMELVDGVNLEDLVVAEKCLPQQRVLEIARGVILGLNAAHRAGLLHRDMKPGNILLTPEGEAKVLDFGLSLQNADQNTEEIIWATPYYVPPETLKREAEDIRTDMYALGMTLRHLLTGTDTLPGSCQSIEELLTAKQKLAPLVPKADYGKPVCDLINHMCAFEVAKRPATYQELLLELEGTLIEIRDNSGTNSMDVKHRHRRLTSSLMLVSGLLVAGALGATFACLREDDSVLLSSQKIVAQEHDELFPQLAGQERLQALEKHLTERNWVRARQEAVDLADSYPQSLCALWAAEVALWLNSSLKLDERKLTADRDRCEMLLGQMKKSPLAGEPLGRALAQIQALRLAGTAPDVETLHPVPAALLQSLFYYRAYGEDVNRATVAHGTSPSAINPFTQLGDSPYSKLGEAFEKEIATMLEKVVKCDHASLKKSCAALDCETMAALANTILVHSFDSQHSKLSERELAALKEHAQLVAEWAQALSIIQANLRQNYGQLYKPSASISEQESLFKELIPNDSARVAELVSFMYMLRGDEAQALASSPYESNSNKPYAVLLRDWLKRAAKLPKP